MASNGTPLSDGRSGGPVPGSERVRAERWGPAKGLDQLAGRPARGSTKGSAQPIKGSTQGLSRAAAR